MKDRIGINVVVIGGVHHNTLGVVRSLGEAHVKKENILALLVGSKQKKNIVSTSKYLKKSNIFFLESNDEIVEKLDSIGEDGLKRAIICCSDGSTEEVIKNFKHLRKSFYSPSTKIDISQLMQKDEQAKIAVECGLTVPHSKIVDKDGYKDWDDFPCIVKPLKSTMGEKSDIVIVNNQCDLSNVISEIKVPYLQIQKYLNKQFEFQLIGCSLDDGNIIVIPGYTNIIRQPNNTNTGYLKYSPISSFQYDKDSVSSFLKTIGYNGLFSIEFIRGEDNKDYFLEINMRNDGNAYCVQSAGINLPYLWCFYNYYKKIPNMEYVFNKSIYFMPEFSDFRRGIKSVGFFKWVKQFICAQSHAIINRRDLKPFWNKLFSFIFKANRKRTK